MTFIKNPEKLIYCYSVTKKEVNKKKERKKENSKGIIVNTKITCAHLILNC